MSLYFSLNSSTFCCNVSSVALSTSAPLLVEASPLAVSSPFGVGFGVSLLGALGDSFTPPRGPISANCCPICPNSATTLGCYRDWETDRKSVV